MNREVDILNLPLDDNDANAKTIKEYLKALLRELWNEQEGFTGKRPFGNSGWDHDLIRPLIKHGLVEGQLDGEGYVYNCNQDQANRLILAAIQAL
jgi:hypothetical protein